MVKINRYNMRVKTMQKENDVKLVRLNKIKIDVN